MNPAPPHMDPAPSAVTGATGDEAPWQRLSPGMLAVHPVQEVIRFLPVLLGVLFLGRDGSGDLWSLIGLGLAVGIGLIRWLTTTYQVTDRHVRVRRGLLRRQELSVPRDRIRSVDLTAHPVHRVIGLQRVVIGTGRSDKRDEGITLDALSRAAAQRLRTELLHGHQPTAERPAVSKQTVSEQAVSEQAVARPDGEISALERRWLRFGPFTLTGLATISVLAVSAVQFFNEANVNPNQFALLRFAARQLSSVPLPVAVVEVVVTSAVLVALLSTLGYLFSFWNFTLTRQPEGTLQVQRGLLTTRSTTIEQRRLRGVEVSESLLLRLVGGARCVAITTGLRAGRGAEHGGSLLLPPAPVAEANRVAGAVFGADEPFTCAVTAHGPVARRRRHVRAFVAATVVTVPLGALWWLAGWPAWTWQAALALFPIGVLLAEDRFRNLGHARCAGALVSRQGSLVRRRYVLAEPGVIGWTVHESFFQRRNGLATLTATTAAGRQYYNVVDVEVGRAVQLADAALPGLLAPFLVRPDDDRG